MVPVCHAAQMSSQVWKTFHVCHLVIITSQETTTICPQRIQAATHHYFLYRWFIFPIKMSENAKEKKCSLWFPRVQRDDFGLNPRDSLFNIMNDKEKQQFLPFKKLKSSKRLIFLLEKWLKLLIKCSCFVLCTYIIWCLTAKGEDSLGHWKQTNKHNRSTGLLIWESTGVSGRLSLGGLLFSLHRPPREMGPRWMEEVGG